MGTMNDATDSLIPYDEIVQEALRAVVGRVLGQVESSGGSLPGSHHFYVTFKTGAPGVAIPPRLKERVSRRNDHCAPEQVLGTSR